MREGSDRKKTGNAVFLRPADPVTRNPGYDTLLTWMNQKFEETVTFYRLPQGEMESVAREYGRHDLIWLKKACEAVFLFFLKDPQASQFRRMLTIEQYKNNDAAKTLYTLNIPFMCRFTGYSPSFVTRINSAPFKEK